MAGPIKVLAIDGGGIRGIIPALVLEQLEAQTGKPIADSFDLIAGTSTGGILALGLVKPGADGHVEHSASSLVQLYEKEGATIFHQDIWEKIHVRQLVDERYDAVGIERTLKKYFGDARMKDALKPALVSSYDIERQSPKFFKSERAKDDPEENFLMREVARATSAAPTYFEPAVLKTSDPLKYFALVDGGVAAGNPAMCAYAEAVALHPAETEFMLVSIGTGKLTHPIPHQQARDWGVVRWAQPIIDIVFQGANTAVDYQMRQLLPPRPTVNGQRYFRLQLTLSEDTGEMDNASDDNLVRLRNLTEVYLSDGTTRDLFDRLCRALT